MDPDGNAAISMSAIVGITFIGVLAYTAVKNYLNTPEGLQGVQALENALTAGAQVAATVVSKSISVITSKVIETSDDKNRATPIYRTGSGNGTNLTPRTPKDSTGLSYSLIKPETGPYTVTSIEAVNKTGVYILFEYKPQDEIEFPSEDNTSSDTSSDSSSNTSSTPSDNSSTPSQDTTSSDTSSDGSSSDNSSSTPDPNKETMDGWLPWS